MPDNDINTQLFEVIVPEVYNKCIPKYFMGPNRGDPPRLNGRTVTWDEYLEAHPEFVPDTEFTPDMVYTPCEMNETSSMETVAGLIDYLNNNVDFSIANPDTAYPQIIHIMEEYLEIHEPMADRDERIASYTRKVRDYIKLFNDNYQRYKDRKEYHTTGKVQRPGTEFDRIERQFKGL